MRPIYGSIFALSTALAAWMFRYRGGFIAIASTLFYIMLANTLGLHTLLWGHLQLMSFILGSSSMTFVTLFVGYQRRTLDVATEGQEQIRRAYEQQRQLNTLKDLFLLNVSHELRTPLTEVQGYLELLRDYNGKLDPKTQMAFIENATRGCEELQMLIANVLDAMHFGDQAGKHMLVAQQEELHVLTVVNETLKGFERQLQKQKRQVDLDIPEMLVVRASRLHVRQILYNLLSNALKYSPPNTPLLIQASQWKGMQSDCPELLQQIRICVQDQGAGIPPDEISHLFIRFARLKRDVSGPIRGSGLGLYICQQLVEGMGGAIWVESSGVPGEGSRFCFTLPEVAQPLPVSHIIEGTALSQAHSQ